MLFHTMPTFYNLERKELKTLWEKKKVSIYPFPTMFPTLPSRIA